MRNLLTDPLWQPHDLGQPIPDDRHAVSACLPTWADNIGYEEQQPRVLSALQSGYPRFFYHPLCRELFAECRRQFARPGEAVLAFPSEQSARELIAFLQSQEDITARLQPLGRHNVHLVLFPEEAAATAKLGWQHLGGGISSRLAEASLREKPVPEGEEAKQILRHRIAELAGVAAEDVFLFPCGMRAVSTVHTALRRLFPAEKTVQFGFPYVDTLKILQKTGPGVHFFPTGNENDLQRLQSLAGKEQLAGLFTEFPSNPLLMTPELERLAELSQEAGFPLVVDDTIAGFFNVDLLNVADVVCSSLTKSFSGLGNVTGGAVILRKGGPFSADLRSAMTTVYEDTLFAADAVVLERNSRDYAERMPRVNATAEQLTDWLTCHPAVKRVYAPQRTSAAAYNRFRRPEGGYGGLLSLVLKDAPTITAPFFDRLRVSKGPNLGTNYTLACPFTILAHYHELDFAESCGVSRWLIRVSVGLEEADDLIARFAEALSVVRHQ